MQTKTCRITVDISNPKLYDAIKQLAAEKGFTLKEVVNEALLDWVHKQEELEDIQAIEEAEGEFISLEEYLEEIGESDLLSKPG